MIRTSIAVVLGLLVTLPAGLAYSQEPAWQQSFRERSDRDMIPRDRRGGMRHFSGMGMMRRDAKLAAMMMEMRSEMMKIRGEAMIKQGAVLKRYGERLEKERGE